MKKVVKKVKDDLCDFKQEAQRLKTIREELNKLRKDSPATTRAKRNRTKA